MDEIKNFFREVKYERVIVAFFISYFFFPYEVLSVSEHFLYLISFVIFSYYLVIAVATYILVELDNRKIQIMATFRNLANLKIWQIRRLHFFFKYLKFYDLEYNFYSALAILKGQLDYNFFLTDELLNFNNSVYNISDFGIIMVNNGTFSEMEESALAFFINEKY